MKYNKVRDASLASGDTEFDPNQFEISWEKVKPAIAGIALAGALILGLSSLIGGKGDSYDEYILRETNKMLKDNDGITMIVDTKDADNINSTISGVIYSTHNEELWGKMESPDGLIDRTDRIGLEPYQIYEIGRVLKNLDALAGHIYMGEDSDGNEYTYPSWEAYAKSVSGSLEAFNAEQEAIVRANYEKSKGETKTLKR